MKFLGVVMNFNDVYRPERRRKRREGGAKEKEKEKDKERERERKTPGEKAGRLKDAAGESKAISADGSWARRQVDRGSEKS